MTAIRSFIAIELPKNTQQRLNELIGQMKLTISNYVRWVPPQNIHLTLKFLGDVSPANLELLTRLLKSLVTKQSEFKLVVGGLSAFPSIKRPRIIWVGISAPAVLKSLQQSIESETRRLGYAAEERPFSPHLTLGRINHNATPDEIAAVSRTLSSITVETLGSFQVQAVTLFRSDLKPGGSVYTPLVTANFNLNNGLK